MSLTKDGKRLIVACLVSVFLVIAYGWWMPSENSVVQMTTRSIQYRPLSEVLAASKRFAVSSPNLSGSIRIQGARIDDIKLNAYKEIPNSESDTVRVLSPERSYLATWVEFGWMSNDPTIETPKPDTIWLPSSDLLSPGHDISLTWSNSQGTTFTLIFDIDSQYMFHVHQEVFGKQAGLVRPFSKLVREQVRGEFDSIDNRTSSSDDRRSISSLVVFGDTANNASVNHLNDSVDALTDDEYKSFSYEQSKDLSGSIYDVVAKSGWAGFNDHYWLTALTLSQKGPLSVRHVLKGIVEHYEISFMAEAGSHDPLTTNVFVGPKEIPVLTAYDAGGESELFRSLGFGYLRWLAVPLFYGLLWLNGLCGDLGLAILVLTILTRIVIYPATHHTNKSTAKMQRVMRNIQAIKNKHSDDRGTLETEVVNLLKKEKINPISSYAPLFIQFPVFIALFRVLSSAIEMRQPGFFGLVSDLSAADNSNVFNLFGLLPFKVEEFVPILHVGWLPVLMGVSIFILQRSAPPPPDPVMRRLVRTMPLLVPMTLSSFPSGLIAYWIWGNILSAGQQWHSQMSVRKQKKDNA